MFFCFWCGYIGIIDIYYEGLYCFLDVVSEWGCFGFNVIFFSCWGVGDGGSCWWFYVSRFGLWVGFIMMCVRNWFGKIVVIGFGFGVWEGLWWCFVVVMMIDWWIDGWIWIYCYRMRWGRKYWIVEVGWEFKGFVGYGYKIVIIVIKERVLGGCKWVNVVVCFGRGGWIFVLWVVGGKIVCKVLDKRVKIFGLKELNCVLLLVFID